MTQLEPLAAEHEAAIAEFIGREVSASRGPTVSFYANELADVLGVSPPDVLGFLSEVTFLWWYEGQRLPSYGDVLRLIAVPAAYDPAPDIEIVMLLQDCDARLLAALRVA